ncbi:hypothetical protein V2H45_17885 [Tumidithrix elongata RA019]|uniref:GerMN domain-containing protein n=1 Tax=Tumidithrix elongata BACA0141 TaxID=2716417 RepID=A0AAW9Q5A1_9CYAN|nr:hypothetical protein [Tumidithrix elongata RA019]
MAQQNPLGIDRNDRSAKSFQPEIPTTKPQHLLSLTGKTLAKATNISPAQPDSIVSHLPKPDLPKLDTKTIPIQIFYANSQCDRLVEAIEQIPSSASEQETATRTLRSLLEHQRIYGFKVSGYKVALENGVATVDITLDPSSQRRMTSLSSCEQFALFASIKTTLMQNQALTVNEVRFTEAGREIYL